MRAPRKQSWNGITNSKVSSIFKAIDISCHISVLRDDTNFHPHFHLPKVLSFLHVLIEGSENVL
jgi:hypothetical protein